MATCALWAAPAAAQTPQISDTLQLERLHLSPDGSGLSSVEGGSVQPDLSWSAGLWSGWSQNPLVAYQRNDGSRIAALVANRVGGSLFGSIGFRGWAQLSFELPAVFFQDRRLDATFPAEYLPGLSAAGIGTLRVTPKVRLLDAERFGVDLAVLASVGIPLSSGSSFTGEPGFAVAPAVAASRALGPWQLAAAAGVTLRRSTEVLNVEAGPELEAQAGVGYRPSLWGGPLPLSAELALFAGTSATRPFAQPDETSLELRGLITYQPSSHLQLFIGGGRGLQHGWGTPAWRAFGGLRLEGSLLSPPRPPPAPAPAPEPLIAAAIPEPPPPPPAAPRVEVTGEQISFEGTVLFETNSAEISPESGALLDSLAAFLLDHPELEMVRVEGHTDDVGTPRWNQDLSNRRASSVVAALVERGVDRQRLSWAGYGSTRPLIQERTPQARARNRRVELHVLSTHPQPAASR